MALRKARMAADTFNFERGRGPGVQTRRTVNLMAQRRFPMLVAPAMSFRLTNTCQRGSLFTRFLQAEKVRRTSLEGNGFCEAGSTFNLDSSARATCS